MFVSILVLPTVIGCRTESDEAAARASMNADELLSASDERELLAAGWQKHAGDGLGLWVSVARQKLFGIEGGRVRFVYSCSTAARGVGNRENSHRTPLGWHTVDERYGDGLPAGAIFRERKYTKKIWQPHQATAKDMILSRILWLRGLEPGVNLGKGIDSHDRYIYIHGTPAEEKLGTPASMGCIRLSNNNVIELFEMAPSGTRVLITKW